MNEVEQSGDWCFIRTEGEISIDWLREITGEKLHQYGDGFTNEDSCYPCGAPKGLCMNYRIDDGMVSIHPDRICALDGDLFLNKISTYLTTRPDLQELLKSI